MVAPIARPGASRREALPTRLLPVLYFVTAHLFLALAFAAMAFDARELVGFFYQPKLVAVVHLITLGWITLSILGSIYVISPMALRMPMPPRRLDYVACFLVLIGTPGMAVHFWIGSYGGVGGSAALVLTGLMLVGGRTLKELRSAPIPSAVKFHIALAFINATVAATLGLLLGFDKQSPFLPAHGLSNVYAHAHLAALGWATLMVMGAGYRMLPMVLPSAMPTGRSLYVSAVLMEAGTLGLFVSLLLGARTLPIFALLVIAGLAAFAWHVGWMRRHPRPAPAGLPRPDYGVRHVFQAMTYLCLSALLGLFLSFSPESELSLKVATVYGTFALVGFLSQMVVGIEARVLPMFASYHANLNADLAGPVVKPHEMPLRWLQRIVFYLWAFGVPGLAAGLFLQAAPLVAAGAGILLTGAMLGGLNTARVLRFAYRRRAGVAGVPQAARGE